MEQLLDELQYPRRTVIAATVPEKTGVKIAELKKPCKRNEDKDLAVIISHLTALYAAVFEKDDNQYQPNSQYALILEDDIRQLYHINYSALVASAPKDFGILQLMTSNLDAIRFLWGKYRRSSGRSLWTLNNPGHTPHLAKNKTLHFWSTQAYLVNKTRVRSFLEDVVVTNKSTGELSFRLINSLAPCKRSKNNPCVHSRCLYSDTYIYAGAGPTYVSNIPLFTGSAVGMQSAIQHDHAHLHRFAFEAIKKLTKEVKSSNFPYPLPSYLLNASCETPVFSVSDA
jgi:hypothetical protein